MEQTKILVVDDDREIVGAIAALLELEGYTVLRAYDGLEALDALHTHDVQLMILDVMHGRPFRHHADPQGKERAHPAAERQDRGRR